MFRTRSYGRHNSRVVFLLTGWGMKIWMHWIFAQILARHGYYVWVYEYDADVLSPDVEKTVRSLTAIQGHILQTIAELRGQGHRNFAVFGTSLGAVIALMVANEAADVSHIILNTTGSDIAETVWSWEKLHPAFTQALLGQGLTLAQLQSRWHPISPINNISHLQGRKVLLYLSQKDEVIPYRLGKALAEGLEQTGCEVEQVVNSRWGHVMTGAINLFRAQRYLLFLAT